MYKTMPTNQLGIRAEMQCHRRAFPSLYRGMVDESVLDAGADFALGTAASRERASVVVHATDEDAEAFRKNELKRVHAIARDAGFDRADLKDLAIGAGKEGLSDMSAQELTNIRESIRVNPQETRAYIEQLRNEDPEELIAPELSELEMLLDAAEQAGISRDDLDLYARSRGDDGIANAPIPKIVRLNEAIRSNPVAAKRTFDQARARHDELEQMNAQINAQLDGAVQPGLPGVPDAEQTHPGHGDS